VLGDQVSEMREAPLRRGVREALPVDRKDPVTRLQLRRCRRARVDRADLAVHLLDAERNREQDHERQQDVHRGPGGYDHDPLPHRLVVVGALHHVGRKRLAGRARTLDLLHHARSRVVPPSRLDLVGVHPGDLHEAAERQGPDAVLGLAALDADELRREEDEEALDPHPRGLRGDEVPELVDDDQEDEARDGQDPRPGA
jgi:hypothetical protein